MNLLMIWVKEKSKSIIIFLSILFLGADYLGRVENQNFCLKKEKLRREHLKNGQYTSKSIS